MEVWAGSEQAFNMVTAWARTGKEGRRQRRGRGGGKALPIQIHLTTHRVTETGAQRGTERERGQLRDKAKPGR